MSLAGRLAARLEPPTEVADHLESYRRVPVEAAAPAAAVPEEDGPSAPATVRGAPTLAPVALRRPPRPRYGLTAPTPLAVGQHRRGPGGEVFAVRTTSGPHGLCEVEHPDGRTGWRYVADVERCAEVPRG